MIYLGYCRSGNPIIRIFTSHSLYISYSFPFPDPFAFLIGDSFNWPYKVIFKEKKILNEPIDKH